MTWTEIGALGSLFAGIGAMLTFAVAIFAALYARRQWGETRQTREEQSQPFVTVALRPSHNIMCNIAVRNEGKTLAHDVRFKFTPEFQSAEKPRLDFRDSKLWREGAPTLVPGQEFVMWADSFPERFKRDDLPRSYDVTVEFKDSRGRDYSLTYRLSFDIFYGYSTLGVYDIHDAAQALRDMRDQMKKWRESASGGLSVFVRDGDARDARERDETAAWIAAERQREVHDVVTTGDASTRFAGQQPVTRPPELERPEDAAPGDSRDGDA